jgi:DNA-binding HxlR family transcriptional regulator
MGVSKKEFSPCPIDVTLSVIDGRWKGTILWRLLNGPMRTNELRKSIPEITERMLLRHLRYSLTPYGQTLVPVLDVLCTWGREHLKRGPSV